MPEERRSGALRRTALAAMAAGTTAFPAIPNAAPVVAQHAPLEIARAEIAARIARVQPLLDGPVKQPSTLGLLFLAQWFNYVPPPRWANFVSPIVPNFPNFNNFPNFPNFSNFFRNY